MAGCSTGEEAYSIAILFDEAMQSASKLLSVKIFATDIDPNAIAVATTGQFNLNVLNDISEKRANQYFNQGQNELTISRAIRQMVVFATHNLINDPPFSNTHLTVCRNVLIYFQPETQKRVLSMLNFSLRKGGYLFLGSSESLGYFEKDFDIIHDRSKLFKKNSDSRIRLFPTESSSNQRSSPAITKRLDSLLVNYKDNKSFISVHPVIEKVIQDYVPACIIVNQDLDITYAFGDVAPYTKSFQSGQFTSNITKIVISQLSIPISTAISKSISEKKSITYQDIVITNAQGHQQSLNLKVNYIQRSNKEPYHIVVFFQPTQTQKTLEALEASESEPYNPDTHQLQRIQDLENQLKENQEHLQITVEELETTNEELQASNEELLASNEELQSTNEELHSVNEELYSVNFEYQEKIEEITNINSDLDNFMKSTDIGILFLDDDLQIRNFTPVTARFINLLESDIGRPLHHISHKLDDISLIEEAKNVINNNSIFEKNFTIDDEQSIIVNIQPYINKKRERHGCVITINDISAQTKLQSISKSISQTFNQCAASALKAKFNDNPIKILLMNVSDELQKQIAASLSDIPNAQSRYEYSTVENYDTAGMTLTESTYDFCIIGNRYSTQMTIDFIQSLQSKHLFPASILILDQVDESLYERAIALGIYDIIAQSTITPELLERSMQYSLQLSRVSTKLKAIATNTTEYE